jgi:hypothetical protein
MLNCPLPVFCTWQSVHVNSPGAPVRDAGAPPIEASVFVVNLSPIAKVMIAKALVKAKIAIFILRILLPMTLFSLFN